MIKYTIHSEDNLDWFQPHLYSGGSSSGGFTPVESGTASCNLSPEQSLLMISHADVTINESSRLFTRERIELLVELWEVFVVMPYFFFRMSWNRYARQGTSSVRFGKRRSSSWRRQKFRYEYSDCCWFTVVFVSHS